MHASRRTVLAALVLAAVLGLAGLACSDSDDAAEGSGRSGETSDRDDDAGADGDADVEQFCAAVETVDRTDGTTEESVAVAAFDELRRTAPPELKDDVELAITTMLATNYPDSADPAVEPAPLDEMRAAGERMGEYVEERC